MSSLSEVIQQIRDQTLWSSWHPLEGCWRGHGVPAHAGMYRIREAGKDDLMYVGETGNLKQRLAMLKPIYGEDMPYRSPHVAGPHLWSRLQTASITFEVSFASLDCDEPTRKGVEYLVIALHRERFQRSPCANFGRMVAGWRASSSNTALLAARGLRYRGGPTELVDESHLPGIAPLVPLEHSGSPHSREWGGHRWSPWCRLPAADPGDGEGLYRLRRNTEELLFVGQGRLADRLKKYRAFDAECSWASGTWHYHQQLELVCDLVASYLLTCVALPPAQFGMSVQDRTIRERASSPDRAWWSRLSDLLGKQQHEHLQPAWMVATG